MFDAAVWLRAGDVGKAVLTPGAVGGLFVEPLLAAHEIGDVAQQNELDFGRAFVLRQGHDVGHEDAFKGRRGQIMLACRAVYKV